MKISEVEEKLREIHPALAPSLHFFCSGCRGFKGPNPSTTLDKRPTRQYYIKTNSNLSTKK
jgi:hypothetical protein